MESLVLQLSAHLQLQDLQALAWTCRLFRQAVQALPAHAWHHSAARTVPAYHPLAAVHVDVPATANSSLSAAAAISGGRITSHSASFASLDALLLQPDFTRCARLKALRCCCRLIGPGTEAGRACRALVMRDGAIELMEAVDVMQWRSGRGKRQRGLQLPGAACSFLHPHSCSPCGRYCLMLVHYTSG